MSYEIKNNPFRERRLELRYSTRQMVQKMKEVDPTGKGVSTMTVINAEKSLDSMKLKTLLMMCNALDISPRTIFTNKNGE